MCVGRRGDMDEGAVVLVLVVVVVAMAMAMAVAVAILVVLVGVVRKMELVIVWRSVVLPR